jgi:hypothetical protein
MALSQDEQRVLAEIERRLAAEDPGLASSLATFRRPSPASVLRSPRARIIGSVFTVLLVAMVSLMVYAMIPFRDHGGRTGPTPSAASQGRATIATAGSGSLQNATHQAPSASEIPVETTMSAPSSAVPSTRVSTARPHTTAAAQATGRSAPPPVGAP